MRDHDECEIRRIEQAFKPLDAFEVKMIGWFVEEQNIRLDDQGLSNRQSLAPTAAEGGRIGIHAGTGRVWGVHKASPTQSLA